MATQAESKGQGASYPFTRFHIFMYRLSCGLLGGKVGKSRVLLLTTTGRKSGKQRTSPLFYLPDGSNFILVASNGGAARHPLWWLNLQANPQAEVQVRNKHYTVTAREATPEERVRLWPLLVAMYGEYENYQRRTSRAIPVVILTPVEATSRSGATL